MYLCMFFFMSPFLMWALMRYANIQSKGWTGPSKNDFKVRCKRCGYNLAGLTIPRCPECGSLRGFEKSMHELGFHDDEIRSAEGLGTRTRIALVTCRDLPDWEVDDQPLEAALTARGVDWVKPAWDDPQVKWSKFDACLIRTTWDYSERRNAFVAWAKKVAVSTKLFNPAETVRWNTDKRYLKSLAERGVPTIETVWVETGERIDVATLMRERGWSRGFIKPVVGASSRGTLRFDDSTDGVATAQRHLDEYSAREAMMMQPYLATVETEGEYSVIFVDGKPAHGVRKVPVPGDYRVQDDYGAHDEPWTPTDEEMSTAQHAIRVGGHGLLYGRADFLRGPDGKLLMNELELVEPSLFFRHGKQTAELLADALLARVRV